MTKDECVRVGQACLLKLLQWKLVENERVIALWIVRLSFLSGRSSVWLRRQSVFSELTRIHEADVSRALRGLERLGVIQRRGDALGFKEYFFLPNAELVEPVARVPPEELARCLAEIDCDNSHRPGDEPGGQVRAMELETTESRLASDVALGSCERAVEPDDTGFVPYSPEWCRVKAAASMAQVGKFPTRLGKFPTGGVGKFPTDEGGIGREGERAPETSTFNNDHDHVSVASKKTMTRDRPAPLASAGKPELANRALRAVWKVVPKADFDPWARRWTERANAEPELVLGFAEDCADRLHRGEKIPKPGAWMHKSIMEVCEREGRRWR